MKEIIPMYLLILSALTVWVTVADKNAAKSKDERVPEIWLLLLGLLGGAAAEWVCMKLIRHKTRHKLFIVGLPVFVVLHVIVIVVLLLNKEFI